MLFPRIGSSLSGMIKGTSKIPADAISDRLAAITRDKKIVLHGSTGTRAEMDYTILKDKGYQVQYLGVSITPASDGSSSIK